MFTLVLASFASHRYCYIQFQPLCAFYGILSAKHLTSLSQTNPFWFFFFSASVARASASLVSSWTHSVFRRRVSNWSVSLLCSTHLVWRCIKKYKRNSLTFHWLCQYQSFSLTFPWAWKIFVFPWLIPTVATPWRETQDRQKVNGIVIGIVHECFFLYCFFF